jgi:lipoprotein-anchoring transpeptidase ErfK/SrfK
MALDSVHEVTGITVSQQGSSVNRMWYELDGAGYAHSSRVQPVRMRFNPSETFIPENGCVGEITVPWVDAFSGVDEHRKKRYRLYYASTLWVTKRVTDADGEIWYELLDDRYYTKLYVPAYSVRLVPDSELTALSPQVPYEHKKLIVDLDHQTLTAYIDDKPITNFRVSTGAHSLEGGFATPKGAYRTSRKRPSRHMYTPPSEFGTGFDLPGVPWVSYFTGDGIALHGTYWHNDFGVPHSHGCINLSPQAAKWIYRWTTPTVPPDQYIHADNRGTRVVIQ